LFALFTKRCETKVKTKFNFQKGTLKTEMEKEYRKAMNGWAKEHYQGLIDVEIATELGKFRILLFVSNSASFSQPLHFYFDR
jgi:hypothetical protein